MRVVPQNDAALRSAKCFASGASQNHSTLIQRVLELSARDQACLMRTIENKLSAPFGDNVTHLAYRQRKQRHRHAHYHELGFMLTGELGEGVEIYFEFIHIEWHIVNLQATRASWTIIAIARVSAKRLRCG